MKAIDLTGRKVGKWSVIKQEGKNKGGDLLWLCKCECGTVKHITASTLNKGYSLSCGCSHYKHNGYVVSGEIAIVYLNEEKQFVIDTEDLNKIKNYTWREDKDGYVVSTKGIKLHRLVMNCPEGLVVDHINHDLKDNKKTNLRICTTQQNKMNTKTQKGNSTGHKGVYYKARKNRYEAWIGYNNKPIYLGVFRNIEDAIKAREEAEEKYFGEFAYKESVNE